MTGKKLYRFFKFLAIRLLANFGQCLTLEPSLQDAFFSLKNKFIAMLGTTLWVGVSVTNLFPAYSRFYLVKFVLG